MAVLRVYAKRDTACDVNFSDLSASADAVYCVWTDSLNESMETILNAPGIPRENSAHPSLPEVFLSRKTAKNTGNPVVMNGAVCEIWDVTCHYESGRGQECEQPPWLRSYPKTMSGSGFVEYYQWRDLDGNPFCTTAGEPLNPPPPIMVPQIAISWKRPEYTSMGMAAYYLGFFGAVNNQMFLGCDARSLQITGCNVAEAEWADPVTGISWTYLDISWDAIWQPFMPYQTQILNKGTRYIEPNGQGGYRLKYPMDDNGQKSLSEIFLDGGGNWIRQPSLSNIHVLEFRTYLYKNLSPIGPI